MSIEQITAKAEQMNLSPQLMDLIAAAYEAGKTAGVQDAAVTLADNDEDEAAEFLATNYGFELV